MSAIATAAKLAAPDHSAIRAIAVYHTAGLTAEVVALSADELRAMGAYYGASETEAAARALGHPPAQWWGNACADLGLTEGEPVTQEAMERLLQQLDPATGVALPRASNGRPKVNAIDITFGAPKDASALMLLGDDVDRAEIQADWLASVQEALAVVQAEAAVVRTGKGGAVHRDASGVVAVLTPHDSARPVDDEVSPHLHTHAVVMNLGQGPDGAWRTLDAARIFELQRLAGAVAGREFRERMTRRFGVEWEQRSPDAPVQQIVGFDALLRDRLSPRHRQLLEAAAKKGLGDAPAGLEAAKRLTREGKHSCGSAAAELDDLAAVLKAEGITFDGIVSRSQELAWEREAAEVRAVEDRRWLEAAVGPLPEDRLRRRDWAAEAARLLANHDPARVTAAVLADRPVEPDWERAQAAADADMDAAELTVEERQDDRRRAALRQLGRAKSTFRRHEMLAAVVEAGASYADAEQLVNEWIREAQVIQIGGLTDDLLPDTYRADARTCAPLYVAHETLMAEREILRAARAGVGQLAPICPDDDAYQAVLAEMACRGKPIDPDSDQAEMLRHVLQAGHRITAVSGQAGAGKSAGMEALAVAVAAAEALPGGQDRQVFGVALAANAARNLQDESGLTSTSIAKLLHDLDAGEVTFEPGAIVVVDEASQASTQQLAEIWGALEPVGGRLIMAGDARQLSSVGGAGGLFADLAHPEIGAPDCVRRLDEVRRQRSLTERVVLAFQHDGLSLSDESLRALRRQAASAEADQPGITAEVEAIVDRLIGPMDPDTGRRDKAAAEGLGAVIDWYQEHNRVVVGETLSDLAPQMAAGWWDAFEAAPPGEQHRASLLVAQTNDEAQVLNEAVRAEGIRRGHLAPEAAVSVGGKTWLPGERVRARLNDRSGPEELLNGMAGTIETADERAVAWTATVVLPGGRTVERTARSQVDVGDAWTQTFGPGQVRQERQRAAAALERAEEYRSRAKRSDAVRRAEAAVEAARERLDWARQLPDEGGTVAAGRVLEVEVAATETQLCLRMDDGSTRWVGGAYAEHHLDGGAAVTAQRGQGQTVTYAASVGAGYVPLSRGREDNHIFLPLTGLAEARERAEIEREHLDDLATHLDPAGAQPGAEVLARLSADLRTPDAPETVSTEVAGTTVAMHADAEVLAHAVAAQLAVAWQSEMSAAPYTPERLVGVARTRETVATINELTTGHLLAAGALHDSHRFADVTWAATMPVRVTTAWDAKGLAAGQDGIVVGFDPDRGLTVEMDDGHQLTLTERQVRDHLAPGWATTISRVTMGEIDADRLLLVGSGASGPDGDDLAKLRDAGEVEIHVTDPELSLQRTRDRLARETLTEQFTRDCSTGKSASRTIWEQAQAQDLAEVGLPGLQAARQHLVSQLDAMPVLGNDDLAKLRLQDELIAARRERKALVDAELDDRQAERLTAERDPSAPAPESDTSVAEHADPAIDVRAERIAERAATIDKCMGELELVTHDQQLLDPAAEAERREQRQEVIDRIRSEEDRHRLAVSAELAAVDASIDRYITLRALEVVRAPERPAYLPVAPLATPEGWERPVAALVSDRELVREVEAFRCRWGIHDPTHPLGPPVHSGGTLEREWLATATKLGLTAELAAYHGIAQQAPSAPKQQQPEQPAPEAADARISFRRSGNGFLLRGPASLMTEGADVEVSRRDGTTTTVRVARLGSPFQLNGETWVDAEFDDDWGAARGSEEQADYGSRRDTDERPDRTAQEKREFAQRQALERARRRQQARHHARGLDRQQDWDIQIA